MAKERKFAWGCTVIFVLQIISVLIFIILSKTIIILSGILFVIHKNITIEYCVDIGQI